MNKHAWWLSISFASVILAVSCKGPAPTNNQASGPVPISVTKVEQALAEYHDIYPGTVVALNEVQLLSEVNGYVTGIYFKEGESVKKGQKLYEIERSKYAAAYAQAEANLQIAKANLAKVQKDVDRYTRLSQQDAIAKQTVDYAQTDLQNAKMQVASAEAQVSSTATDLRHSTIHAPFDGTIGFSNVKLGALVSAGQTLLNTVSSDEPIAVDFVVSEKEMHHFLDLQTKPVTKADSVFTILLPNNLVYEQSGHIAIIDRAVDPQTGTIRVRLNFPNPGRRLKTGMSCNVRVLNSSGTEQLLIPYKAVTEQMGEYFVYAVENNEAHQRKIALGARIGDNVIVRNGLKAGEVIALDGIQKLKEGAPVQIGDPGATASAPNPAGAAGK